MKYINRFLLIVFVSGMFSSCTSKFEETNVDPNNPVAVPSNYLLTGIEAQLTDILHDEWNNGRMGSLWAQYWSQNQYTEESRYQPRIAQVDNLWTDLFAGNGSQGGGLRDVDNLITLINNSPDFAATAQGQNQIATARILRAYMFHTITDIWGDIPYSQALQGTEFPQPSFDKQEDIYADLLVQLTEASGQIDESAAGFTSGDVIYNGNMTLWKKLANSLKMRVAIRMSDVNAAGASAACQEAFSAGVFSSVADMAGVPYGSAPDNHPLNVDRTARADFAVSNTLVDWLMAHNDPRLEAYAEPASDTGTFIGLAYGLENANADAVPVSAVSQPSGAAAAAAAGSYGTNDVLRPDFPGILMDYAEVCFTVAEAAERGFVGESASAWYDKGIEASMNFWGIFDGAAIADYIAANPYDAGNWKSSIGQQKWVALYSQGIQGWIEARRLDEIAADVFNSPADGGILSDETPTRLYYPTDVVTLNNTNYSAVVQDQGLDLITTKVWWDVN